MEDFLQVDFNDDLVTVTINITIGKQIKAVIIPEFQYHSIFPNAVSASIPLKPSS